MNWLNIYTPILRSPEFIGSDPVARATWFSLLAYCVEQENGGRIPNCRDWKDRQWQQTAGVTADEVNAAAPLVVFDGSDAVLWSYPSEKEAEVRHLREIGKSRSAAKVAAAKANGNLGGRPAVNQTQTQQKPNGHNPTEPIEGKGREGEGKEKGIHTSAVPASVCVAEKTLAEKTTLQLRVEKLFNRRPSTVWGKTDAKAWASASKAIEATHEDDLALLEWFYARPPSEPTYRRRDLATLLNNWNAEIDRAREYRAKQFSQPAFDKPRRAENLPLQIA